MQNSPTKTFGEFLVRTIERMRPSVLRDSFGRGVDDCLLERTWQMEWYRTARTAAPEESTISPDVGYVFGSDGFLDFYVDGDYGWGVELMREGKRLGDHAKRFEQGGQYEVIPMNDWAILDFRHHFKRVRNLMPNFWYVLYSDDYKQVTIVRHDKEDRVLRLIGDDFK
ncbi:1188_t:CDS:1 [Paraglomus occultum]|uniref:1188_t:CDS:1 n=1 Tax=Paraglomus occultum TaxID=144539 RepID=A0A9N9C8Y3_9GLOM|nr:1188_t:CDS:1 [Paraglomus occultum]